MKRILVLLLCICLPLCGAACAEEAATDAPIESEAPAETLAPAAGLIPIAFEDGFALSIPSGWKHYTVTGEMASQGVLYCLGDESGERWLYIQSWGTDCTDVQSLCDQINETASPENSGIYNFNGSDFVVYDLSGSDVSCCVTLLDGRALNFVFTPQSDADFMVIAAQIIGTFTVMN